MCAAKSPYARTSSTTATSSPEAGPHAWKAQTEVAILQAVPQLAKHNSRETSLLLTLLCFFKTLQVTADFLWRGATAQPRWGENGEIEVVNIAESHLDSELVATLSDRPGLVRLLHNVEAENIVRVDPAAVETSTFTVNSNVAERVLERLPHTLKIFWSQQALLIASNAFPRKFIEPLFSATAKVYLPHFRHALTIFRELADIQLLSDAAKADILLSLVEASRMPGLEWKVSAIAQAKELLHYVKDIYHHACVAQRDCLISRISNNMDNSASALRNFWDAFGNPGLDQETTPRINSEIGHLVVQTAINHIQMDDPAKATEELRTWQPLDPSDPSTAEGIAQYHINLLQGKALRYRGRFAESLECLQGVFDEVRRNSLLNHVPCDLICNIADTYCELHRPAEAGKILDDEIQRQVSFGGKGSTDWYLLHLSRAEVFWQHGLPAEARDLCKQIGYFPSLPRFSRLRLLTLFARIEHAQANWTSAQIYWTRALEALSAYPLVNGHTTRLLLLSMNEVLMRQGHVEGSRNCVERISQVKVVKSGGCRYWIPGLGRWCKYLTRRSKRLRAAAVLVAIQTSAL